MEDVIAKLLILANKIVVFGKQVGLEDRHNLIRGDYNSCGLSFFSKGQTISLYFSDKSETWSLKLGIDKRRNLEIIGYSEKISFPWDMSTQDLIEIHNEVENYFMNNLHKRAEEHLIAEAARIRKSKEDKIARLREELDSLIED